MDWRRSQFVRALNVGLMFMDPYGNGKDSTTGIDFSTNVVEEEKIVR